MPRDSAGTYTLPPGINPVESGTVIESDWANNTMNDIATALTDSLDRNGRGGMSGSFSFVDGTVGAPGATWTAETNSGFYRAGAGDMRVSILGSDLFRWVNTSVQIWAGSQWNDVAFSNTGTTVPPGTSDGQTLRWENADPAAWELSDAWKITDAGNCVATGNISASSGVIDAGAFTEGGVALDQIYTLQTTTLTAGDGLTGGGDLSANRSFAVGAGDGISVAASTVAIDTTYTDALYYNVGQQVGDADSVDGYDVSVLTTAAYEALSPPDPNTLYFLTG